MNIRFGQGSPPHSAFETRRANAISRSLRRNTIIKASKIGNLVGNGRWDSVRARLSFWDLLVDWIRF